MSFDAAGLNCIVCRPVLSPMPLTGCSNARPPPSPTRPPCRLVGRGLLQVRGVVLSATMLVALQSSNHTITER
jgi:hypothetical protein